MKKMLIAAHGRLAEGLFSALALILGEKEHIGYINAFIGDTPLEKQRSEEHSTELQSHEAISYSVF